MTALQGLRVLDLSPHRIGAQISQLFADFGAEVIWVEPPGGARIREESAFPFWGRGKQSLVADLRVEADRAVVRTLAEGADVFIETNRPGSLDQWGLGYAALKAVNPRLVYVSVSSFGSVGPYVDLKDYEPLVHAKLGVMQAFRRMSPIDAPPYVSVPWCSFPASQVALHGALASLYAREHTGVGQHVETSMAQAYPTLDTWSWFEYLIDQRWPDAYTRVNNFDDDDVPVGAFPFLLLVALTKDGRWLQFASVSPRLFQAAMKALGLDWMFTDPKWAGLPVFEDQARRLELWSLMHEAARTKTLAEWQQVFDEDPNVFAEQFRIGQRVLDHPQLVADGMVADIVDDERGPVHQPAPIVRMYNTPAQLGKSAPRLGTMSADQAAWSTPDAPVASVLHAPARPLLDGVSIVEFGTMFAAPNATRMLADLGAHVVHIEELEGDGIRMLIPFPEAGGAAVMQGKESLCVDLQTDEGRQIVYGLIASADVVVQAFRAGVAERLGFGYEKVKAIRPDVVYLNAPGYGTNLPYGQRPAYAPSIGAAVGIPLANTAGLAPERADLTLEEIQQAARLLTVGAMTSSAQADGFAALGVATAILTGLLARERGAGGQEMLTTMLNTGAHAMSEQIVEYPGCMPRLNPDPELKGINAVYRVCRASAGFVFLAAPIESEWADLVLALQPYIDLSADHRFTTVAGRRHNDAALGEVLEGVFATRTDEQWEHELRAANVSCVAISQQAPEPNLLGELGQACGFITTVNHPTFDDHPRMNGFMRLSDAPLTIKGGVLAGQQTDEILTGLGIGAEAIADLRARKIVG